VHYTHVAAALTAAVAREGQSRCTLPYKRTSHLLFDGSNGKEQPFLTY
jgi:hypothetical protein